MQKRNAARGGKLKPNTVRVMRDGTLRIGQDLLGEYAGQRDLRFSLYFDANHNELVLAPQTTVGWPVHYSNAKAKSPRLRMTRFFHMMGGYMPKPGEYAAVRVGKQVICQFDKKKKSE